MGTGDTVEVPMTITNVLLVDNSGVSQLVNVINDELIVGDTGMFTSVTGVRGNEIVAYPNPANQTLQIQIPDGKQQLLVIEDMSGRVVYSQNHQSGASMIWVADLPGGVYLLRTTDPNGNSSTRKIVIAH